MRFLLDLLVFALGLKLGDKAGRSRLLTKKRLRRIWLKITGGVGPWSIGLMEGSSPFELRPASMCPAPILTGKEVTDLDALFVADPFMIFRDGFFFIFFEIMERKTEKGCIGVAKSKDLKEWEYLGVVLKEAFHLSFPFIFESDGHIYMVPESSDDWSVRLYQATNFPFEWKHVGNLLSGYQYKDPTLFFKDGLWWMFVSAGKNEMTNLYFSKDLIMGWKPHPLNPIIRFDKSKARSAGKILEYNGGIYRLAQDNSKKYGRQVFAWEITDLSQRHYSERQVLSQPLVSASGKGWNRAGMHTLNLYPLDGKWIGCVDGRRF